MEALESKDTDRRAPVRARRCSPSLEKKFQRELDLTRTRRASGGNNACRRKRRFPIRSAREDLAREIVQGKVGVIENTEELPPELQSPAIAQLVDRYIFPSEKSRLK